MSDVAVVGFAQAPCLRRSDSTTSGVEMLVPVFRQVLADTGLSKDDIGFWCSGSSDYLAGRAFSFVQAVDAIGAFPPVMESHVEMDAAWALYEAWLKLLAGEAETALVYGFGKSSAGDLRRVLTLQLDPYLQAPLWPDSVSVAALQARLGIEAGRWSEKEMAEVAARSRAAARGNPQAQVSGEVEVADLLAAPYVADPLRAHDCAPVGDGAAVAILAAGDRARELCRRPAWITGFEHRIDSASLGARDLTRAPSAAAAARAAGLEAAGPQAMGPQAMGPQAMGAQAMGAQAAGPRAERPQAAGPRVAGPQAVRPQAAGVVAAAPGTGVQARRAAAAGGTALGREAAGVEVAELHAPFTHQEILLREALGLDGGTRVNPSGGALCGNPMFAAGLARIGMAAGEIFAGRARRVLGHATSGPALQQNLICVMEAR